MAIERSVNLMRSSSSEIFLLKSITPQTYYDLKCTNKETSLVVHLKEHFKTRLGTNTIEIIVHHMHCLFFKFSVCYLFYLMKLMVTLRIK